MAHVDMALQIERFQKIAHVIVENVKTRVTSGLADDEIMHIIYEEILSFFVMQQRITVEYMNFNEEQRANFAAQMYSLLEPLACEFKGIANPKYADYVAATGKTGALNFMVNA
ncbi:hypothetical protein ACTVNX_24120 [Serratia nevei]|uniref:Uncharacterized protein n=1 Tax=Serratia marcescens SM39 TaxID=1334564 RepID=A0AAT9DXV7_SERMA|nr:hypothetical protein [Serratia marcescens]MBH2875985.1 hypothetical protein [Serratia marcescens]MBI6128954.1 hypothetical protein [Serratia marcescens]BAO32599.1 hypothetical protein SM39_0537 [Serratia marcescens SM39]